MGDKRRTDIGGINAVLAANLRRVMRERAVTQKQLEAKSGVAQSTISLYLNPEQRQQGATGKEPSAKIAEVARLAGALDLRAWELLRPADSRDLLGRVQCLSVDQRKVLDSLIDTFVSAVREGPVRADVVAHKAPSLREPGQFVVAELKLIPDPKLALQAEYRAIDAIAKFLHQGDDDDDRDSEPTRPSPGPASPASAKRTTRRQVRSG